MPMQITAPEVQAAFTAVGSLPPTDEDAAVIAVSIQREGSLEIARSVKGWDLRLHGLLTAYAGALAEAADPVLLVKRLLIQANEQDRHARDAMAECLEFSAKLELARTGQSWLGMEESFASRVAGARRVLARAMDAGDAYRARAEAVLAVVADRRAA